MRVGLLPVPEAVRYNPWGVLSGYTKKAALYREAEVRGGALMALKSTISDIPLCQGFFKFGLSLATTQVPANTKRS